MLKVIGHVTGVGGHLNIMLLADQTNISSFRLNTLKYVVHVHSMLLYNLKKQGSVYLLNFMANDPTVSSIDMIDVKNSPLFCIRN